MPVVQFHGFYSVRLFIVQQGGFQVAENLKDKLFIEAVFYSHTPSIRVPPTFRITSSWASTVPVYSGRLNTDNASNTSKTVTLAKKKVAIAKPATTNSN